MNILDIKSPLGALRLTSDGDAVVALDWISTTKITRTDDLVLMQAARELGEYFAGRRKVFTVKLRPQGTAFGARVWSAMQKIPFGAMRSYGELATRLGTAPRPLAGACGRNPIPILIPCHRVVGAKGALGGYSGAGGVKTKQWLLELEGRTESCCVF